MNESLNPTLPVGSVDTPKRQAKHHQVEHRQLNPAIILLVIVFLAMFMTYVVTSGEYQRKGILVVPGSYQTLEKDASPAQLWSTAERKPEDKAARPVSLTEAFLAIPQGIEKSVGLIFMVLFIGGMLGILSRTGTITAGLERLLGATKGNVYVLVPCLMLAFSAGSTFMGMAKEYIVIVPLMVALANRMGLPNIVGLALVVVPLKIGYLASVTSPVALSVAQPIVGLPVFSGMGMRLLAYVILLIVGTGFMFLLLRRYGFNRAVAAQFEGGRLTVRQALNLLLLGAGIGFLIYASNTWHWHYPALSAYYLVLGMLFAAVAGLRPSDAANAFIEGMQKVLIAGVMIGLATAVQIILATGDVLDSIVNWLAQLIGSHGPFVSALGMFFSQLLLELLIPSTSGQAAVTMPIFGPLAQLSGVTPQTTVYAFLLGHGLTNMISPTSSGLLVLLAAAQVGWGQWARMILPLMLVFSVIAIALLMLAVLIGY
ncbi:putative ion transporter superfamily protein YfcC [Pseudomonas sp. JUb42]|jgi:uncharacterized ion transporter superfamily protein YfcC|uniref:YfcC family protein n=1 Tax=Pseudomonas sp. JUb42 TaxID=2940611 RepID=UPI00216A8395|nr:AbgT family transporter [Pseudomonas sp. JUb42]MCS3471863.1 putative ion transporter superfamily protein YfcC [Pseudomonas sp. JUb42]